MMLSVIWVRKTFFIIVTFSFYEVFSKRQLEKKSCCLLVI